MLDPIDITPPEGDNPPQPPGESFYDVAIKPSEQKAYAGGEAAPISITTILAQATPQPPSLKKLVRTQVKPTEGRPQRISGTEQERREAQPGYSKRAIESTEYDHEGVMKQALADSKIEHNFESVTLGGRVELGFHEAPFILPDNIVVTMKESPEESNAYETAVLKNYGYKVVNARPGFVFQVPEKNLIMEQLQHLIEFKMV